MRKLVSFLAVGVLLTACFKNVDAYFVNPCDVPLENLDL